MLKCNLAKLLLAASAAAGFAFLFAQAPSNAASASFCAGHARTIAGNSASIGTSKYRRVFDAAYAKCRGPDAGMMYDNYQEQALTAAPAPAPAAPPPSSSACDFSKYHTSWDPTVCP